MPRPRIVIVGGGFAGLAAARSLSRSGADVLLYDRQNHHLFQPLLYQVATAGLAPSQIAVPIRNLFARARAIEVRMDEVRAIDPNAMLVRTDRGTESYDYLVIAAGTVSAYFGHDEWQPHAPGLKTIDDALEIRRRFLTGFERAELEPDEERRRALTTFVVIGGGPTGVELAGSLAEIALRSLPKDFRRVDTSTARIVLVEAGERLLPAFDADQSERARVDLTHIGVEVRLSTRARAIDAHGVELESPDGLTRIETPSVFWAAGVQAEPIARSITEHTPERRDRLGRIAVLPDLSVPGYPRVFAAGDIARHTDAAGKETPGVAQGAMQMGRHAARIIRSEIRQGPRPPHERPAFRYRDKGNMATIGRRRAVADFGWLKVAGMPAWLLWAFVHIAFLVGFRNKFITMFEWIYSYITFRRGARLITGQPHDLPPRPSAPPRDDLNSAAPSENQP